MFTTSVLAERLMPKGWGVHLLGDLWKGRNPDAAG
jgi:hypothetical protein